MNNCFPKGSEWRKWDLHVHTPKSLYQLYGGDSEDVWEEFICDLEGLPKEFKVIGINDYLFLDGYKEILKYKAKGRLVNIDLFLPVIELRIKMFGNIHDDDPWKRINLHVIFSSELSADLIKAQFIDAIQKCYYLLPEHNKFWSGVINKESLIDLGKNIIESSTVNINQSPIKVGFNNLNFNEEEVLRALEGCHLFKGKYLKAIGKGEWDALRWDGSIADKKDIINKSDFVFTAANNVSAYNKSKQKLKDEGVKDLLIDCSDAHSFSDQTQLKDRISNCFSWIKSDPTFNGLKQIVFEPETRLRIQEDKPEEKKKFVIIDKVNFITKQEHNLFSNKIIEINDKLNAIIGGKSSGKSLLLYYIAKTIDPIQVKTRFEELEIESEYDFEDSEDFDFEVSWKDGKKYKLKDNTISKTRQITYIPQMYINYLAEKRGKSELKNLIKSILEEKESFKEFWKNKFDLITQQKIALNTFINRFFQLSEQLNQLETETKGKGDKLARTLNIQEMNNDLAKLRTLAGITVDQEKEFKKIESSKSIHSNRLVILNSLFKTYENDYLNELRNIQSAVVASFERFISSSVSKFSNYERVRAGLSKQLTNDELRIKEAFNILIKEAENKSNKLKNIIALTLAKIEDYNALLVPYFSNIQNQSKVSQLKAKIQDEQAIVDQITILESNSQNVKKQLTEEYSNIISEYSQLFNSYQIIVTEINSNKDYSNISAEKIIKLSTSVSFDFEKFGNSCTNLLNKQSPFSTTLGSFFDYNTYVFDLDNHINNFKKIFDIILSNALRYNQGGNLQNVTRGLFDDYFSINFELFQNGENILRMSPGKKGLILLFLILHLSNADYPILIDQPEDNLDNRTVYSELKDFIKAKKIERQIIIVTHNANLVVTTDSELVIVANQSGQDHSKENEKFQFEYITGALENSFPLCSALGVLNQMGIKEHVCDILEGGEKAFIERENRYDF